MRAFWVEAVLFLQAAAMVAQPAIADGLDTSWNGTGTLQVPITGHSVFELSPALAVQPDGRLLLAGICRGSAQTLCMARLLPNGVRDFSFGPNKTGIVMFTEFPSYPAGTGMLFNGLLRQSDGRIVIGGTDSTQALVTRLLANGTLDPSVAQQPVMFGLSPDTDLSGIYAVAQQADGKIVVAGPVKRAGSDPVNFDFAVARLRPDLTLDPSFNGSGMRVAAFDLGGNNADTPLAVAIQPDGKIIAAGVASTATGTDAALLRLNANGTLDASFGNNGRAWFNFGQALNDDGATSIRIDRRGRIWVAGIRQWGGTDHDFIVARVLADGSGLDPGFCSVGYRAVPFDLDAIKTDLAYTMLLQSDGKIVLAGVASVAGGTRFAAARLLPNCNLDPTFGTGGKLTGAFAATAAHSRATAAAFGGSGIVLAGSGGTTNTDGHFSVAQIRLDLILTDGFDPPCCPQ